MSFISPGSAYTTQFNPYAYGNASASTATATAATPRTALIVPPSAPPVSPPAPAAAAVAPTASMSLSSANGSSGPTTYDNSVVSAPTEPPADLPDPQISGMEKPKTALAGISALTLALLTGTLFYGAYRPRGWARQGEEYGDVDDDHRPTKEECDKKDLEASKKLENQRSRRSSSRSSSGANGANGNDANRNGTGSTTDRKNKQKVAGKGSLSRNHSRATGVGSPSNSPNASSTNLRGLHAQAGASAANIHTLDPGDMIEPLQSARPEPPPVIKYPMTNFQLQPGPPNQCVHSNGAPLHAEAPPHTQAAAAPQNQPHHSPVVR